MKPYVILPVAVIAAIALYFLLAGNDNRDKAAQPVPVQVLRVYADTLYDRVESLGTTYANESIDLSANVAETIVEIGFEDGQAVRKGDLIALLSQQEEKAQLAAAQARQQENRRELKRLETLLKNRAAAQREYDERLTLIEITRQEIEAIEARIADRTLRAPFDGVLGIRRLSVGALVQPGEVIATLDDISRMKLDFTVPAIHMDTLRPGIGIDAVRDGMEGGMFHGTIYSVNSRIDPVTRSILVRAILPNDEGILKPGLLMRVTLRRNERQALVIAEESLIQRGRDRFVLVVPEGGGKVEQRRITTGTRLPGMVEVLDGLQAGELVIVRGVNMVTDGQEAAIAGIWERIRRPRATNDPAEISAAPDDAEPDAADKAEKDVEATE